MRKHLPPILLFLGSLGLYLATLAPSVVSMFDDSLELQLALPTFSIVHPTGYPAYTLLGWLATKVIPFGDMAWRANAFSALAAAAAVAALYPVARRLGAAAVPTFIAAALLAVSPVWWSQATIAEVYAAQGLITLLVLYALLRWDEARDARSRRRWLVVVGLTLGLGLTHHRLTLLLSPAALVFILWGDPSLLRRPRAWFKPILALLAPLLFYAILPLRAGAGSLDGAYAQVGFWGWILGGGYSVFLRDNPFGVERGFGDLLTLFVQQYGLLGILIVFPGYTLWRMQPRRLVLLALIALADLIFAWQYLVLDIQVFLIPLFIIWALFIAVGLTVLWDNALLYLVPLARRLAPFLPRAFVPSILALILLLWPTALAQQRLPGQDRSRPASRVWRVYDRGLDNLQSAEADSVIVGLLGEMTLLRYFQRTEDIRPDVETIAADRDDERLAAIAEKLARGDVVYTTRAPEGLARSFSLSSEGPLIRIWPPGEPQPATPPRTAGQALTSEVTLTAWDIELLRQRRGPSARLSLLWRSSDVPSFDFKVSTRLLDGEGALLAQEDNTPVRGSYPPTSWRAGESVLDVYDLRLEAAPAAPVTVQVILYRPADGAELARWEQHDVTIPGVH